MRDKFTMWWTMHILIPIGALFLAHRALKEEIIHESSQPGTIQPDSTEMELCDIPA